MSCSYCILYSPSLQRLRSVMSHRTTGMFGGFVCMATATLPTHALSILIAGARNMRDARFGTARAATPNLSSTPSPSLNYPLLVISTPSLVMTARPGYYSIASSAAHGKLICLFSRLSTLSIPQPYRRTTVFRLGKEHKYPSRTTQGRVALEFKIASFAQNEVDLF